MLRIAKLHLGGEDYYLEVSAPRRGAEGLEAPGEWAGRGSESFGLIGEVSAPRLSAMLAGDARFISAGERGPLVRAGEEGLPVQRSESLGSGRSRVKVAAFDLTFAAPKSVSILFALGGKEVAGQVAESHQAAVSAALSYVERRALALRRRSLGEDRLVATEGALAAGFLHRTSRALDPHLHTHVVLANLALGTDGRWSALDGRGVYAHARATEALYHVQLRHELTRRLGVGFEPSDRGRADIAGIGPEARSAFSRRSREIASHLEERGLSGPRAVEIAAHATRAPRADGPRFEELVPSWQERARAAGLSPRRLESVMGRVPARFTELTSQDLSEARIVRQGSVMARLEAGTGLVTRRDLVRAWAWSMDARGDARAVEQLAERSLAERGLESSDELPGIGERRHELGPSLGRLSGRHLDRDLDLRRLRDGRRTMTIEAGMSIGR
jgi:conjugative relaxase-like TrwC/TraI family protein